MCDTLTASTLALTSLPSLIDNLKEWKNLSSTVVVLVSTLDARSNAHLLSSLTEHGIDIEFYEPPQLSRTPSLQQIISVFHRYPHHQFYSFVNADIETNSSLLSNSLFTVQKHDRVLFASRQDYSDVQEPKTYYQGFDFFSIPSSLLCYLTQSSLHRFFIGQVGWDYYLPLSLPRSIVQFSYDLPLYHSIHPTGSQLPWADSIVEIFPCIHDSWLNPQSYYLKTVANLCRIIFFFASRIKSSMPSLHAPTNYFLSRIICYALLHPLLRQNTNS